MDFIYNILTRPPLMPRDLVFRRRVGQANASNESSESVDASKNKEHDANDYKVKPFNKDKSDRDTGESEYKGSTSDKKKNTRLSLYESISRYE